MRTRSRTRREVEIKLPVTNIPHLMRQMRRLGARSLGRVLERNVLYDTPDSDFWRRGYLLRIRTAVPAPSGPIGGGRQSTLLTFKVPPPSGNQSRYKQRLERELWLRHGDWGQDLRSIGFRPGFQYEKYRTRFRLPGLDLDLDETPAGIFLELEGAPAKIDRVARALGFAPGDYIRGTYWDIYVADCRRRGKNPKNMLFRA